MCLRTQTGDMWDVLLSTPKLSWFFSRPWSVSFSPQLGRSPFGAPLKGFDTRLLGLPSKRPVILQAMTKTLMPTSYAVKHHKHSFWK